ncbi:MAG: oxygen-dependent coproporphyrinogen oxidase [Ignavibacteriales bacterium]|nr:oxygen-dependent coproporphyrinogen oxidase [Ignavibacteriales bacterium]
MRERVQTYFEQLQNTICKKLEDVDGKGKFIEDAWQHSESGGGKTHILQNGYVFEKAGVNFSAITSSLSEPLATKLNVASQKIFATGVSLVIHPYSPMIPTTHLNVRFLQLSQGDAFAENGDAWFGGGMDLTPYYLFEEDAKHFHSVLKNVCDKHDSNFYPRFKKWCDEYFFIKHRNEVRGIGGIFFDYLKDDLEKTFSFVQDVGNSFLDAYIPIVKKRKHESYSEHEKEWQLIRRGRYVEFNLVYDRGTLFGLETQGRTESILMSLPPEVKWKYDFSPQKNSREEMLLQVLQNPKEWV